ncbi:MULTISPECIES: response regulator [unclassified Brevundimonas]|uniref:response regulator n=1 Tax=unclassified Brevundimonas TaxID=2622653 RepID=UPI0025C29331|nr:MULTISPECIES: response regulator [unclassified Brevundimonas]
MPSIETLTECVPPISPEATVPEVFNWFANHPDSMALPVVDGGRPVGLIDRQDFLLKLASPLGQSRYSARPVSMIMDPEPAVVDADVRISAFSETILKSSASTLMRGFIVTRRGRYFGVGTAIRLFHFVNGLQAERIRDQEALISELETRKADHTAFAEAIAQFVRTLTTALEKPLKNVEAFAGLIGRQPHSDQLPEYVSAIRQASRDGALLLQQARDLAQADAGHFPIDLQPVVLRVFMDSIAADWAKRAESAGMNLMVSYEGDTELAAMIDGPRFRATYDTLIDCALKWSRNGTIEAGLKATVVDGRVQLQARVRDDGPGLEPDLLNNCFGDLATTGDLATANAWNLLNALKGRIFAENNKGRGTTYGFDVTVDHAILAEPEQPNIAQLDGLDVMGRPHVLIADDNATNRVVARALCEMFGCTSETAEDGQEAVDAARDGCFDMILMDIKMPRMDGVQATLAIRGFGNDRASVPIIALTANADPDDVEGYIKAGMLCVVEKPIKPERLRMAMIRAMSSRSAVESLSEAPLQAVNH